MTGKSIASYREGELEYGRVAASCDALLVSLREHHDFNVTRPENWKPEPKKPERPTKRPWFSVESNDGGPRIRDIQGAVADHFNLTEAELLSASRTQDVMRPRQIGYYLSKKLTMKSLPEIGRRFGRDHTTCLSGIRKIEALRKTDEKIDADIRAIAENCGWAHV